jgi:tetratricopeptide (TPR) repeat protein
MSIDKRKALQAALTYTQQGKLDRAIAEYQAVLRADPSDLNVLNALGDLYARVGNKTEAIAHYMRIGDAYRADALNLRAIAAYKKVVKLDPSYTQAYLACADLYAEQGLTGEARLQLEVVAEQYLKGGDLAKALEIYEKMVQLDQANIPVVTKVADLLIKTGKTDEALRHLNTLGERLVGVGQMEDALRVYKKIVQLQPTVQGFLQMARTQIRTGSRGEAEESLRQAEALATDDSTAWVALGRMYHEMGEGFLAEQWFQRAREAGLPEGRLLLLELYQEAGRWTEALAELRHVGDLSQFEQGEPVLKILDRLIERLPEEVEPWSQLLEIFEQIGARERLVAASQNLSRLLTAQGREGEAAVFLQKFASLTPMAVAEAPHHLQAAEVVFEVEEPPLLEKLPSPPEVLEEAVSPGADVSLEETEALEEVLADREPTLLSEGIGETDGVGDPVVEEQLAEADVYVKYGLLDKAIQHLRRLLTRFPGNIPSRQKLMQLSLERGERDEAIREGLILLEIFHRRGEDAAASTTLENLHALAPDDPRVQAVVHRFPSMSPQESRPGETPPSGETPLESIEPLASQEPTFELLEELVSSDVEEKLQEGDFYVQQGMVEEARAIFQRILLRDPGHQGAQTRLAALAGKTASGPEEITVVEADVREQRDIPIFKMAVTGPLEGEYVDLASELSEELNREEVSPVTAFRADLEDVLNELQRGVREHVEAGDYETHYNLGIAYKDMELYDEAIEEFHWAAQDPAYRIPCSSLLGLCYLAKGDPGRAVVELRRGLDFAGAGTEERWGTLYDLATAYEALGDLTQALEALMAIQEEAPKFRDVRVRIRDLRTRLSLDQGSGERTRERGIEGKPPRQRITFI